jgi:putative restriction endonuclease
MPPRFDTEIRLAAFRFLRRETELRGDTLPFALLREGFVHDGLRVHLMNQQGIFKPKELELPISITTAPRKAGVPAPYDDAFREDGLLQYHYRGIDPIHRDNRGLRTAMERRVPLIYFHGIVKGEYFPAWPVLITGEDRSRHSFLVQVEADAVTSETIEISDSTAQDQHEDRRRYCTTLVTRRLHQAMFRERVVAAYGELCAICRLRRTRLLDAAHIRPDADGGQPDIANGISLCKLHHAAFDQHLIGIRPDVLTIEVRRDVLDEEDGPMLLHGLQEAHGVQLALPKRLVHHPDRMAIEYRYDLFRRAQ